MNFTDVESQLEGIGEIFDTARTEDKWNLDEEMLYSYYFVDESIEKLEKLGLKLEADGYDFIDIFELGDEETDRRAPTELDDVDVHARGLEHVFPRARAEALVDHVREAVVRLKVEHRAPPAS